ncbi:MAG: ImmA/IrrE family metallo-endopeptidase [Myxococcales bacterium]|nr:ImmA/IrrE family metallo-endopeptidase [Polyangiaceae bacterium]MDW8248089.1 ImmA/IrrE family metallo-endopeptidase [Myxococcales bacterium]
MSQLLNETVVAVPPLSLRAIEERAAEIRALLVALTKVSGLALPWDELVDRHLPRVGLLFYPASAAELGDREAATDPSGEEAIHILMRPELYEALTIRGPGGNRARATVAHELGHAVLHVPFLRRQRGRAQPLTRVSRAQLAPFRDPEWQAWAFAGCLLMPRSQLAAIRKPPEEVAQLYGVSIPFAVAHYARLRLPVGGAETSLGSSLLLARAAQPAIARARRAR